MAKRGSKKWSETDTKSGSKFDQTNSKPQVANVQQLEGRETHQKKTLNAWLCGGQPQPARLPFFFHFLANVSRSLSSALCRISATPHLPPMPLIKLEKCIDVLLETKSPWIASCRLFFPMHFTPKNQQQRLKQAIASSPPTTPRCRELAQETPGHERNAPGLPWSPHGGCLPP